MLCILCHVSYCVKSMKCKIVLRESNYHLHVDDFSSWCRTVIVNSCWTCSINIHFYALFVKLDVSWCNYILWMKITHTHIFLLTCSYLSLLHETSRSKKFYIYRTTEYIRDVIIVIIHSIAYGISPSAIKVIHLKHTQETNNNLLPKVSVLVAPV